LSASLWQFQALLGFVRLSNLAVSTSFTSVLARIWQSKPAIAEFSGMFGRKPAKIREQKVVTTANL
jgi:hypothetical protein